MDLTSILGARKDAYAKRLGNFVLADSIVRIGDARETFNFVSDLDGRFFRIVYRCLDGKVRDMTGRQGVYNSRQDGEVQGIGRPMRCAVKMTLSFHTDCHGVKVNTGSGMGYRTIRAAGILAIRCEGTDILTDAGLEAIRAAVSD